MENNPINNQNIDVVSEETTHTVNRKAMLFISLSIIIPAVINQLGNLILPQVFPVISIQGANALANTFLSAAVSVIELILVLVFCSKLTNNRTEAVHFLGIHAMGGILGSIITSALDFIHEIIFPSTSAPTTASSLTMSAISVIGTVAAVIFTCLLYNRLIGKNSLHYVSFADYSTIRKNMIFAFICIILASLVQTAVIGIIPVLESTGIITQGASTGNFILILSDFIGLMLTVSTFAILYLFGFRHSKNRDDALNFASCYYFPYVFTTVLSFLSIALSLIATNLVNIAPTAVLIVSLLISVLSIVMFVAEILIVFWALRQIFPVQQITPTPYPAEETYTDDFYVEPSHIENAEIQEIDIEKISNDISEEVSD